MRCPISNRSSSVDARASTAPAYARPVRTAALVALALTLLSCGDPYSGRSGSVIDAHVTRVLDTSARPVPGSEPQLLQRVEVELDGSLYRGDRVEVGWGGRSPINANGLLRDGDRVLVSARRADDGGRLYAIEEIVRLPSLLPLGALLAVALLVVARLKGLASLAGLVASVAVFLFVVVPEIQIGADPIVATVLGTAGVLAIAVYVVHGFNRKSTAALVGTAVGLVVVTLVASVALGAARITGLGSEEAVFLAVGTRFRVDMPRLVLAGVMVASLGALVDMAVGQASTTFELARIDPDLRGRALYASALNVGRDHIGSLVNTLALAYLGGALPLVVLLSLGNAPIIVAANGETIVTSVLAVIVASVGLVACVPVTTAVAVAFVRD